MEPVNRFALIVRPKRRYAEWVQQVDRDERDPVPYDLDAARANPTVYLIVADENEPDPTRLIDRYSAEIFEQELEAWCTDETTWPVNRNPRVFRDWFEVTVSDMLFDLDAGEAYTDDPLDFGDEDDENDDEDDEGGGLVCAWCREPIDADAGVTTVTLKGERREPQAAPTFILVTLAGREVPVMIPSDDSEAGREGIVGMVMFCGEPCSESFKAAWIRERGALVS